MLIEPIIYAAIAVVVIAIIIGVSKKKKKRKKADGSGDIKPVSTGAAADRPKVTVRSSAPVPNVIYVFPGKRMSVSCPFCDGENEPNAATCSICGENIASRKR